MIQTDQPTPSAGSESGLAGSGSGSAGSGSGSAGSGSGWSGASGLGLSWNAPVSRSSTQTRARELATIPGLAHALRPSVMRLARRLRQMQDVSLGLNSNQLSAMAVLLNRGDLSMGALAGMEQVQPPSMTRIVNGLEERGYVARRSDPGDRRHALVTVTEAGRAVLLANRRRRDEWLSVRLVELEPEERDVLAQAVAILEKVNHA